MHWYYLCNKEYKNNVLPRLLSGYKNVIFASFENLVSYPSFRARNQYFIITQIKLK